MQIHRKMVYHPQANGLVERLHHSLKAAIQAWLSGFTLVDDLPWILFSLRMTPKEDLGQLPATLTVTSLWFQDVLYQPPRLQMSCSSNFRATNAHSHHHPLPAYLTSATNTFLQVDAHCPLLMPPYQQPYLELSSQDNMFIIDISSKKETVSINRLKLAFLPLPACPLYKWWCVLVEL